MVIKTENVVHSYVPARSNRIAIANGKEYQAMLLLLLKNTFVVCFCLSACVCVVMMKNVPVPGSWDLTSPVLCTLSVWLWS